MFLGEAQVGVIRDHGQGQVEAIALARQYFPLGNFTTRDAAVAAIFMASITP